MSPRCSFRCALGRLAPTFEQSLQDLCAGKKRGLANTAGKSAIDMALLSGAARPSPASGGTFRFAQFRPQLAFYSDCCWVFRRWQKPSRNFARASKKEAVMAKQVQSSIESTDTVTPARKGERDTDRLRSTEARIEMLEAKRALIGLVGSIVMITSHETYEGYEGRITWTGFDLYRQDVEIAFVALTADWDGDEIVKAPDAEYGLSDRFDFGQFKVIATPGSVVAMDSEIARLTEKHARLLDAS